MTLRYMKIFVSVYEHNSITKAADVLHLAQPSVSLAIKEMEEYYGTRFFERIGRHISPTGAGNELYRYALHIIELFDEMEQKIKDWDHCGTLRIGASITIGTHILPLMLKQYQEIYPMLKITVIIKQSAAIEQLVLENKIDIALIENQPEYADIMAIPFTTDHLCAIVPVTHPLADKKWVTLEEVSAYPFLMREKGSAGREILDAGFELKNITVHPVWESTSTQAIVKAVSVGLGVAVLPYLLVKKDMEENHVCLLPFKKPLKRNLNVIYYKRKYFTEQMKSFIDLCRKYGKGYESAEV